MNAQTAARVNSLLQQSQFEIQCGNVGQAKALAEQVLQLDPNNVVAQHIAGHPALHQADQAQIAGLLLQAQTAMLSGNLPVAKGLAQQVLQLDPGNVAATSYLSMPSTPPRGSLRSRFGSSGQGLDGLPGGRLLRAFLATLGISAVMVCESFTWGWSHGWMSEFHESRGASMHTPAIVVFVCAGVYLVVGSYGFYTYTQRNRTGPP